MPHTPFHFVPKQLFTLRMLVPAAGVFLLGIGLMGLVADPQTFQPGRPGALSSLSATTTFEDLPDHLRDAPQGGLKHWRVVLHFASHVPETCWSGNAVNDFQRRQCEEFWTRLELGAAMSLLPFGLVTLFLVLAQGTLGQVYSSARKRLASGKPLGTATVTQPARAPADLFSLAYCMQAVAVQMPGGKQVKVYLPRDSTIPEPGMQMAVYEPVVVMGQPRHFAQVYAPHVAVVAGVRRR